MRRRSLGKKLALAGASGLATLGIALAGLELWASYRVVRAPDVWVASVRLNHVNPPGRIRHSTSFVPVDPDWPEPFDTKVNTQGWIRDTEVSLAKPPGTYRIFYVGDSFVEGQVPTAQSLPGVMESTLNAKLDKHGLHVEVVNAGCWSYSPILYYINIRYFLKPYAPDAIVLVVDMTDDYDDWKYSFSTVYDRDGLPWAVMPPDQIVPTFIESSEEGTLKATWLASAKLYLYRKSYFYNWLIQRRPKRRYLASPKVPTEELYQRWAWCREEWDPITARNASRTVGLVGEIARYCKREGIRLLVTSVPHWEQYSGPDGKPTWSTRPHREIERVARENGAPYLDSYRALEPKLRGTRQNEFYFLNDMHLNPRGYALWAQAHVDAVCDPSNGVLTKELYDALH